MIATHSEVDNKNITHYFCEHHSLEKIPKTYNITGQNKNNKKLLPLFIVLFGVFLLSIIRQFTNELDFMIWMMDFMGIFFITFGLFKLYDLKGFVEGFKTYDILAKKFTAFGYAFPFIEIILGIMYLAGFMFLWQNIAALIIASLGIYSAHTVVKDKQEIQCVCLGTIFNMPMTKVTLIENGAMFIMALFMLLM